LGEPLAAGDHEAGDDTDHGRREDDIAGSLREPTQPFGAQAHAAIK
jgi:hypothetical protein